MTILNVSVGSAPPCTSIIIRYKHNYTSTIIRYKHNYTKGKAVPLQAWSVPEGSRKLRFPDYMITAQDGGRLSALRTGRLYPQEIFLVHISARG